MWLISIFVITNSYKGRLLSFLSFPSVTGIRTIADLATAAEQNSIKCYTEEGDPFIQTFIESNLGTRRSIWKCLTQNLITSGDSAEIFLKSPSKKAYLAANIFMAKN